MANAIALIKLLISLGPDIMKFMRSIEDMLPEAGQGAAKLSLIRGYMEAVWQGFGTVLPTFEEFWPKMQSVINAVVVIFNSIGIFKK